MNNITLDFNYEIFSVNAKKEILACNEYTERFGLVLSDEDAAQLVENRREALKNTERIEFGGGILPKLIFAFCDSPYLDQDNFKDTLMQLQEAFYYYKGESEDAIADDELVECMVKVFNGRAQGSVEYLIGTSLYHLSRYAKSQFDPMDADSMEDLF